MTINSSKEKKEKKPELSLEYMHWKEYVVFDTESTGFQPNDIYGKLTQISGIRVRDGEIIGTFNELINPEIKIPKNIVELTGITDEMVKGKPTVEVVLGKFYIFCMGSPILIMHNASHDLRFVNYFGKSIGLQWDLPYFDTVKLAKTIIKDPNCPKYSLGVLADYFKIENKNHHQADNDALVTYQIYANLQRLAIDKGIITSTPKEMSYPGTEFSYGAFKRCALTKVALWKPRSDVESTEDTNSKYILYVDFAVPNGSEFCSFGYNFTKGKWTMKSTSFPITHWKQITYLVEETIFKKYNVRTLEGVKNILLKERSE